MKNIIVLLPGPFLKRDYDRFGIEILKKNFSVKVFDCTAWLNRNFWQNYVQNVYKSKEHIVISCKEDFLKSISKINNAIVIDCLPNNRKAHWIRKFFKEKKNLLVVVHSELIPLPKVNLILILKKIFSLILKPRKLISKIYNFLQQRHYSISRPVPDVSFLGGLAASNVNKSKIKINAHSMNYDVYLKIKNKETKNNSYAVFLDEDMVYHPDLPYLNIDRPVTEQEYYPPLLKFFRKFEKETGLKIKFAAHPKSLKKNRPKLPLDIDYSIGNTEELVKNSSLVLLHSSTSISYAILFKKPIIFLTSNELMKSWIGPRIDNFSKVLNGILVNMSVDTNERLNLQSLLKIDEHKYKNYLDQYIKVPNSPSLPLWEIFAQYFKENNFQEIK